MKRVPIENLSVTGDWQGVIDRCRTTVSKGPLGKEPSEKFKRGVLMAEHTPIRYLQIHWLWRGIPSWVCTHFCRHVHAQPYVSTQRDDRTGIDRNAARQDTPVILQLDVNADALIAMMRKRLCGMAHDVTRSYAEDVKKALQPVQPELSDYLVPNCVYRCGCPEFNCCGKWQAFAAWVDAVYQIDVRQLDIADRYRLYNEWFNIDYKRRNGENND